MCYVVMLLLLAMHPHTLYIIIMYCVASSTNYTHTCTSYTYNVLRCDASSTNYAHTLYIYIYNVLWCDASSTNYAHTLYI